MSSFDPIVIRDAEKYVQQGGEGFNNYVVAGGNGLLGAYILDFISEVNLILGIASTSIGLTRRLNSYMSHLQKRKGVKIIDYSQMENELKNMENIHVLHAASPASAQKIQNDINSILEANINLTDRILKLMEHTGGRLTFFSSGEVYGNEPSFPTKEDGYSSFDHLTFRGIYPEVKRFTETKLYIWHHLNQIPVTILRIFHTFGPGITRDDKRIFASAIFDGLKDGKIILNSNGQTRRSFLYSSDLVSGVKHTEKQSNFEVYNISGDTEISILEFAELVKEQIQGAEIEFSIFPQGSSKIFTPILRGSANTDKLKKTGWSPKVSTREAIQNTLQSTKWRLSQDPLEQSLRINFGLLKDFEE
jgi:UDP-glucuronate decarboxylase